MQQNFATIEQALDELRAAIAKARREYRDAKAARKAKKAKNA